MTPDQHQEIVKQLPKQLEKKYPDLLLRMAALNQWIYKSLAVQPTIEKSNSKSVLQNLHGICGNRDNLFRDVCEIWGVKSRRVSLVGIPHHIGHVGTEVWVNKKWRFYDSTLGTHFTVGNEYDAISIGEARYLWPNVRIRRVSGKAYSGKPDNSALKSQIVNSITFAQKDTVTGNLKYSDMYIDNEIQYEPTEGHFNVPIPINLDHSEQYCYRFDQGIEMLEGNDSDLKAYVPYISRLKRQDFDSSISHQYLISTSETKVVTIAYEIRGDNKIDLNSFQIMLRQLSINVSSGAAYSYFAELNDRSLAIKILVFPPSTSLILGIRRENVLFPGSIEITSNAIKNDEWAEGHYDWHLAETGDLDAMVRIAGRFYQGDNVFQKDLEIAYSMYDRSANAGVAFAKYMRSYISLRNPDSKRSLILNIEDFQKSLTSGVTLSSLELARLSMKHKKPKWVTPEVLDGLKQLKATGNAGAAEYVTQFS